MPRIEEASALRALSERARRILAIFPHPDDESYGPAGTLARYRDDADTATAVFILTRGEASSMGPQRGLSPDEVAALRRTRLDAVDRHLGLDALLIGSLPDSGMQYRPWTELVATIEAAVDAFRPHVVIAHDPRGVNAHPDHVAAHWAIRGVLAERPDIRLAMLAYRQDDADAVAPRLLFPTPDARIDCVIDLTEAEIEAKQRALDEHEALVTLRDDGSDRIHRPAQERYDFLGERIDLPAADLFAGYSFGNRT
ncbi:MAG: PIG-L family deacetylase [Planctomycetota bacterium]